MGAIPPFDRVISETYLPLKALKEKRQAADRPSGIDFG